MTTLREAAQQALEALGLWATGRDMDAVALNDLIHRLEAALAQEQAEQVEQARLDAVVGGVGITLGGKRIDPASIYKQAEQAWVCPEAPEERAYPQPGHCENCGTTLVLAQEQAEPVQEPVAFIHRQGNHWEVSERHLDEDERDRGWTEEPLYTAPPKTEPVQEPSDPSKVICPACCHQFRAIPEDLQTQLAEPVAWYFEARHIDSAWAAAVTLKHPGPEGKYMRKVTPLYAAPPQRKPLTVEELTLIELRLRIYFDNDRYDLSLHDFARAIEWAHGIV